MAQSPSTKCIGREERQNGSSLAIQITIKYNNKLPTIKQSVMCIELTLAIQHLYSYGQGSLARWDSRVVP